MRETKEAVESTTRGGSAIQRAAAHGIDVAELRAMLRRTPTERLQLLRARIQQRGESAVWRAEAYGIDISLLKLALTWTPTERVQKALELAEVVRTLHRAGAKKHGPGAYPEATDEL